MLEKPPLGLKPQDIYDKECHEARIIEILDAMMRYTEAQKPVPKEWINELERRIWRIT